MQEAPTILLHPDDDVAIARLPLAAGQALAAHGVTARSEIPFGHKIALRDLAQGAAVRRYNQIIGFASQPIRAGEHVHVHNVAMGDFERDYAFCSERREVPAAAERTFQGFVRPDGRAGTRNYIALLCSVNCSATVIRAVADHFRNRMDAFPNVDGVIALTHGGGCSVGSDSDSLVKLRRTLAGYARHPNVAGAILVGLGCETNQISTLVADQGLVASETFRTMTINETGGSGKTIRRGIAMVEEMLPMANAARRVAVPASKLCVALECGGSDGCSGISANPALGAAVDRVVAQGGTAILGETPEIFGAEHLLTRRAVSPEVGQKLIDRIRWWDDHLRRNNAEMNNNPSAGNKAGGLTTILEKSLGAVAKAGSTSLAEVYEYAEQVMAKGMVFMDTPGNDAMACTGQIAGGANLMVFTTGRGSAYGGGMVPSIKLATNTPLWLQQEEDMDVNCGGIIDGTATIDGTGADLFERILRVASGERTKSEQFGYGQMEFVPWHVGVTM